MKELTYEDWLKNPTPRLMWVWDNDKQDKRQRKVIYFIENKATSIPVVVMSPVVALSYDGTVTANYKHCAEIEEPKTRRMTKKELSRWLREKPTREFKYGSYISCSVYSTYTYGEDEGDVEVRDDIVIREDDGEWREPLV